MPPLTGLENRLGRGNYKHAAPLELSPTPYVKEHGVFSTPYKPHLTMGVGEKGR